MRMAVGMCALMGMVAGSGAGAFAQQPTHHWAIVVHGGAGVIEKSQLGPEGDKAYRAGLDRRSMRWKLRFTSLKRIRTSMQARGRCSPVKERTRWTLPSWTERP